MLFDWFTLVAQLVNFLVLVWLLKRFLYKPILNAIDEREKLIAAELHDAEISKVNASKELSNYQQKSTAFDQQRQELLSNAISEVSVERQKLLEQTRNEIEILRSRLMDTIKMEHQNLSSEIVRLTRMEVFAIARKTLADLASVNLEDQMAYIFINRINELKLHEKELLHSALKQSLGEIYVNSTFELTLPQQSAIQNAIKSKLAVEIEIKFESIPHLVSGIELITNGYKVSWTIDDYLVSLEAHIADLLSEKTDITSETKS